MNWRRRKTASGKEDKTMTIYDILIYELGLSEKEAQQIMEELQED